MNTDQHSQGSAIKIRSGLEAGKTLGDTLEKIFKATGIADRSDKYARITGRDCGCEKRHEILDKIFPL